MFEIPFNLSEKAFLLSCVQEVIQVWSSHGQANLNLSVNDGHAVVHLGFQLGNPRDAHAQIPPHQPDLAQSFKYKSPARKEKDRARAAAHQTKLQQSLFPPSKMQPNSPQAVSADAPVTNQTLQNLTSTAASAPPNPVSMSISTSAAASAPSNPVSKSKSTSSAAASAPTNPPSMSPSKAASANATRPDNAAPAPNVNRIVASATTLSTSTAVPAGSLNPSLADSACSTFSPIAASAVATSPSSQKKSFKPHPKFPDPPQSTFTPNKRVISILNAKAERLTENYTMNLKIAYSGHQGDIEDAFMETVRKDPIKFIEEDKVDEIKLKEFYKSTARSFGVRLW